MARAGRWLPGAAMMAGQRDTAPAADAQEATGIYPCASGYPEEAGTARGPLPDWQAAGQPLPDPPGMEQLPEPAAPPHPGDPPMPTAPPAATPTVWTPRAWTPRAWTPPAWTPPASTPPVGPEPSSAPARHVRPTQARPQETFSGGEGEPPPLPQRQPGQR